MKNLYLILGVRPDCGESGIKSAYRKKAHAHHPDRGGDARSFSELSEAYEVLSDPEARRRYDAARAAWIEERGAIGCPACGTANRIPPRSGSPICAHCKGPLPAPSPSAFEGTKRRILERTVELAEDTGTVLAEEVGDLLVDGIRAGFSRLRDRTGLRSRRGKAP